MPSIVGEKRMFVPRWQSRQASSYIFCAFDGLAMSCREIGRVNAESCDQVKDEGEETSRKTNTKMAIQFR